ncbi:MAG: hypothetical protein LUO93_04470 [Methanomicrobiales archaeon]|nr:hypothetical protein [Methanomicrobiales archaeon]
MHRVFRVMSVRSAARGWKSPNELRREVRVDFIPRKFARLIGRTIPPGVIESSCAYPPGILGRISQSTGSDIRREVYP